MIRRTNARLAGIAYLTYLATAFPASMLAFEVPVALWLIFRGVAEPRKPAVA
jgi:hypothetical protein